MFQPMGGVRPAGMGAGDTVTAVVYPLMEDLPSPEVGGQPAGEQDHRARLENRKMTAAVHIRIKEA